MQAVQGVSTTGISNSNVEKALVENEVSKVAVPVINNAGATTATATSSGWGSYFGLSTLSNWYYGTPSVENEAQETTEKVEETISDSKGVVLWNNLDIMEHLNSRICTISSLELTEERLIALFDECGKDCQMLRFEEESFPRALSLIERSPSVMCITIIECHITVEDAVRFAAIDTVKKLNSISFENCTFEEGAFKIISRSTSFMWIEQLSLNSSLKEENLEAFFSSPYLNNLKALNLNKIPGAFTNDGLKLLSQSKFARALESLNLVSKMVDEGEEREILDLSLACFPKLLFLHLAHTKFTPEGMNALGENCKKLQYLKLRDCKIDAEIIAIIAAWKGISLEFLDLSYNGLAYSDLKILEGSKVLEGLDSLRLNGNPLGLPGIRLIARMCSKLTSLHIENCGMNSSAIKYLATAQAFTNLATLHLSKNRHLKDKDIDVIMNSNTLKNMAHLHLAGMGLSRDAALYIANSPISQHLLTLNLSGNYPDIEGIANLLEGNFENLTTLNLSRCNLFNDAAHLIAESEAFPSLEALIVRGNPIDEEGINEIVDSAKISKESVDVYK